jgi:cyclopropane-fatty-acyl-phospholipid synthase
VGLNIVLRHILKALLRTGTLRVTDPDGRIEVFGDGTGDVVHLHVKSKHAERMIAFDPMLAFPEAYMDGELEFISGDVLDLLHTVYQNTGPTGGIEVSWTKAIEGMRVAFRRLQQINTATRSLRNVQHHYDLSEAFYRLFLDEDMQYSCAYFDTADATLEEAQLAKKRHIAAKLCLEPRQCVLDIGSGWGGLGLYLAKNFDVDVLGVTLSTEQHAVATERAAAAGLENFVHFELQDYRDLGQRFDRIVSVGMFEHVGINHYRTFFDRAATLLKPDGVMVLHAIGRSGPPAATAAFIRKHIFPGGYIPALSEVLPAIEKAGLVVADIEILRLHYAETLRHWRARFHDRWEEAERLYGARFCRMWDFYLAGSEAAFRWQDLMVFQIQLARRNDVVPITRDYMAQAETELAARDGGKTSATRPRTRRRQSSRPR